MPTYDYVCETCGNRFEEWQKITDEPTRICPACGGPVHRVIYPVGLVFKGSGFYKTDNRAASPVESSASSTETKEKSEKTAPDGKAAAPKDGATGTSASGESAPAGAASKSE